MGLFSKSLLLLIIAVSTPLIYRQFANDHTIKFMSTYYSNYKTIDQFLRQSAGHLDKAREYIPKTSQLKEVVEKVNKQFNDFVKSTAPELPKETKTMKEKSTDNLKKKVENASKSYRVVECPTETKGEEIRLWTKRELAKFDGNSGHQDILLALLGIVYNVTENPKHYSIGEEYNALAGRDATRAFLTGNFTGDLTDDITDLDFQLYNQLESWASFYQSSYPVVGRLEGSFYDNRGCATNELNRIEKVFVYLQEHKAKGQMTDTELPACNTEWNGELKKGRVWCTATSGGSDRGWIGVPRIYSEDKHQRCACFNLDDPKSEKFRNRLSVYPGCKPNESECPIQHGM